LVYQVGCADGRSQAANLAETPTVDHWHDMFRVVVDRSRTYDQPVA